MSHISPSEAADRLAIRELVEAYAHCAGQSRCEGLDGLFTEDTHFVVDGSWLFAERLQYS
jgi:SnoaL-like protein